jgi:hypothetical protein
MLGHAGPEMLFSVYARCGIGSWGGQRLRTGATRAAPAAGGGGSVGYAPVRLRTSAAKRFKKVERATAVIWKTLLAAEQRFRRLDVPEFLPEVAEGVAYVNGERAKRGSEQAAA